MHNEIGFYTRITLNKVQLKSILNENNLKFRFPTKRRTLHTPSSSPTLFTISFRHYGAPARLLTHNTTKYSLAEAHTQTQEKYFLRKFNETLHLI